MPYLDILLHIDSYPSPTPPEAVDEAVAVAAALGGKVSALAVEVDIPLHSNQLADYLIGLSAIEKEEEGRSAQACRESLARFTEAAQAAGVFADAKHERTHLYDVSDLVVRRARTRDLCILPVRKGLDGQREVAPAVVFGSGRPTLVFKVGNSEDLVANRGPVVLAWDGGATAARALANAMPVLQRAPEVRILTVLNEKPSAVGGLGAEARRHLEVHGVKCVVDEVDAGGKGAGGLLEDYVKLHEAQLLVMGAFGHSRLREFVLGGATQHMLAEPPCPLLLSH